MVALARCARILARLAVVAGRKATSTTCSKSHMQVAADVSARRLGRQHCFGLGLTARLMLATKLLGTCAVCKVTEMTSSSWHDHQLWRMC